ncbi:MAG: hypothetical protein LBC41_01090 [Clostridiales bacterium]|jgi:hypothetical protein|nr:hypothetical protein [Clostridiales bacterium]MDR2749229.1 hypothetical protein [Clostridiales bacterium]
MKGLVELTDTESMEVKGGAFDFASILSGIFSLVTNIVPTIQSLIGGLFGLL